MKNATITSDFTSFVRLSLPLMLFLFCETLTLFVERIFLSHYSIEAVHASVNASYFASIFQTPCVAIAAMAQVFVGFYHGSSEYKRIGPCVWQLIWFSLGSLLLIIPLSYCTSSIYFKNTVIQDLGTQYFRILAIGNFLFPLSTTLSSFYLGRGKTFLVTVLMLTSYALNLLLSFVLIFGIDGILPSLGIKGAALAKCFSLGFFCSIFFLFFLSKTNRELYATNCWKFSLVALWSYTRPGLVRAFGYFSSKVCWVAVSYLMIKKGGEYLDVLTVGGTIISLLVFIVNGIYQAVLTVASNLLGAKKYQDIWRLCRSFTIYISLIAIFLFFPLIFFPDIMIYFFDSSSYDHFRNTFVSINHWIWLYMIAVAIQLSLCGIIVAARDIKFQFYTYLLIWVTSFLPAYFIINQKGLSPDTLWLIMAIENVIFAIIFFFRLLQGKWKEMPLIYEK